MEQRLGQPFIVENRGGAGTTLGATAVARSEPDGYTHHGRHRLDLRGRRPASTSGWPTIRPRISRRSCCSRPCRSCWSVHPSLGVSTRAGADRARQEQARRAELRLRRRRRGASHLLRAVHVMTGIDMKHVPYRGGGPALNDVVAGHVPVYFADAGPGRAADQVGPAQGARRHHRDARQPSAGRADAARGRRHRLRGEHLADDGRAAAHARADRGAAQRRRSPISCGRRRRRSISPRSACSRRPARRREAHEHIRKEAARWTEIIRGIGVSVD